MKRRREHEWQVALDESCWECTRCRTTMQTCSLAPGLRFAVRYGMRLDRPTAQWPAGEFPSSQRPECR